MLSPGMTVAAARRALADAFRGAAIESPELDARLLAGHALDLDHTGLATADGRVLGSDECAAIEQVAARRLAREPVARILGRKEFWGLPLRVSAATLVPRPETETLVEAALDAIGAAGNRSGALQIADLGTGSGALLLALLSELPQAIGFGTDINPAALATARDNATALGLHARANFVACDFGAALPGHFDLVVSNPPYIASAEIGALAPEVRHDPRTALDGGTDGLVCYRTIVASASRLLKPAGHIVLELGLGQEAPVSALLTAAGFISSPARADLAGIPRALVARVATKTP